MKILVFCPTGTRLEREVVNAIFNQRQIPKHDVLFTRDNPYEYRENIRYNYEKMRKMVLNEGYDKVWCIEADTIPPLNALSMLLSVDAPVVSGLYILRHGNNVPNVFRYSFPDRMGGIMSLEDVKTLWGQTVRVSGGCTGCAVFDRSVFEGFSFYGDMNATQDIQLMEHCCKMGVVQMARFDVVCGHKKPTGDILIPDKDLGFRVERTWVS